MWYTLSLGSLGCVVGVVNLCGSQQGVLWLYLGTGGWVLWFGVGAGTGFRVWETEKTRKKKDRVGNNTLSPHGPVDGRGKQRKNGMKRMIVVVEQ